MHDLDVTSSQISLVCHWQEKTSGANLAVNCYKLSFSIVNINLNTHSKVECRIKKTSWHFVSVLESRQNEKQTTNPTNWLCMLK